MYCILLPATASNDLAQVKMRCDECSRGNRGIGTQPATPAGLAREPQILLSGAGLLCSITIITGIPMDLRDGRHSLTVRAKRRIMNCETRRNLDLYADLATPGPGHDNAGSVSSQTPRQQGSSVVAIPQQESAVRGILPMSGFVALRPRQRCAHAECAPLRMVGS
ncbi:MAG: hypothetical protein AMJ93_05245 [Anaerolineae bacterium SM23_84]|nr:MAG: hypothetical protein AMJ93_05245 [Anaerolineae bacterium SM23_84]